MGLFNLFKKSGKKQSSNQLLFSTNVNLKKIKDYFDIPKSIKNQVSEIDRIASNTEKDIASRVVHF